MSKILLGNVKGPKGDTGAQGQQGIQGETGATGERGSVWYYGTDITGTDTTGQIFSGSGIDDAKVNDAYLNTSTCNVYQCVKAGDADTAEWAFIVCIEGAMPSLVDNLKSTSTTDALTANQGRVLNGIVNDLKYPMTVYPTSEDTAYTLTLTVLNKTTTITITGDDDDTGTYSYTASGTNETVTLNITVGISIGLQTSGAVIKSIASSAAGIVSFTTYDNDNTQIEERDSVLWDGIQTAEENVAIAGTITDGADTLKTGLISKLIDSVRTAVYPITHAKAVWFDKTNNKTVVDKFNTVDGNIAHVETSTTASQAYTAGQFLVLNGILYKVTQNIANGGTITVGTNVTPDTVGGELATINSNLTDKATFEKVTVNASAGTFGSQVAEVFAQLDHAKINSHTKIFDGKQNWSLARYDSTSYYYFSLLGWSGGTWYQMAIVHSSSDNKMYQNGNDISSTAVGAKDWTICYMY